jgi:hypothetical protein
MGPSDPIADAIFSPGEDLSPSGWRDYYINLLKNLEPVSDCRLARNYADC